MTRKLHAFRLRTAVATALLAAVATAGHAAAKNHDSQGFQAPTAEAAQHDRAPGPRLPD